MGIAFHQQAVLKCSRFHLVRIGDEIFGMGRAASSRDQAPLHSGRKSGPAAAAKIGFLYRSNDFGRAHFLQSFSQRLISAGTLVTFQIRRIADVSGERLFHDYLYPSKMLPIFPDSRSRCVSSSTIITGAWSHAPRQTIGRNVKRLSGVVSPGRIDRCFERCCSICG